MRGRIIRSVLAACVLCAAVIVVALPAWAAALPAPRTEGGMSLFEALKKRASAPGGDFPTGALEKEELSTILWAATGLNRGEKGWTVPMARGLEPYCKVYVADETGVSLYNWKTHSLDEISGDDIRAKSGSQNFVRSASCILIVTADAGALAAFNERDGRDFANVAAGAMTQDIYLASAALGVGTRYIHSMKEDDIRAALRLDEKDWPICLMMLGK